MTKEQYIESINKFSVLGNMSEFLRSSYLEADPSSYDANLKMLELAEGDLKTAKISYLRASYEATAVYEKEAQAVRHEMVKKAEVKVQSSEQSAAENLIKNI